MPPIFRNSDAKAALCGGKVSSVRIVRHAAPRMGKMTKERRWLKSVIDASKTDLPPLPWQRGDVARAEEASPRGVAAR